MAHLRSDLTPAAFGEFTWDDPDDVVDVPNDVAAELLAIPDAAFVEVLPEARKGRGRKTQVTEPDPDAAPSE